MDNEPNQTFDDTPGLDGPDYVALVIEWDELADSIEDEVTAQLAAAPVARSWPRQLVAALGALAVLAFAGWGIQRWRAAC
jgi:hypothetical protein